MTTCEFSFTSVHPSWLPYIKPALEKVDKTYLSQLYQSNSWLPGSAKIFNAFTLPFENVNYVLLGESPYPRASSANGYAFWDSAVNNLWSATGLSKEVNRATSMRNIIKTLLVAEGLLNPENTSQPAIAALDKQPLIQTNHEFFTGLLNKGFLLLNASLVLQKTPVSKDAQAWQPFIKEILECVAEKHPQVELLLFGNIANTIDKLIPHLTIKKVYAEHPYNLSFIQNQNIIEFFRPLHLLKK